MDLAYGLFMAESEGLLNTRTGKINAVIKELQGVPTRLLSTDYVLQVCSECGLEDVTQADLDKIARAL